MRNLEDYLDACLFFGNAEGNFRVFVHVFYRSVEKPCSSMPVKSGLHGDFHLSGAGDSGLNHALRALIAHAYLLACSAIG